MPKKIIDQQTIELLKKRNAAPSRGRNQRRALRKRRKIRKAAEQNGVTLKEQLNRDERAKLIKQIKKWMKQSDIVTVKIGPCVYCARILGRASWKPNASVRYVCKITAIESIRHFTKQHELERMPLPSEIVSVPWHTISDGTYASGVRSLVLAIKKYSRRERFDNPYFNSATSQKWATDGGHRQGAKDGQRWHRALVLRRLPFKGDLIMLTTGETALVLEDVVEQTVNILDSTSGLPRASNITEVSKIIKRHEAQQE